MQELADRKHPYRLPAEVYKTQRAPIFITIRAQRHTASIVPGLAPMVRQVLFERAERFGLLLHAYCIMPDHLHIVCSAKSCESDFESFVTRLKSEVTRRARGLGHARFAWERSYWDRHARREEDVPGMVQYVLDNPVRKELCQRWEDWPWSEFVGWSS